MSPAATSTVTITLENSTRYSIDPYHPNSNLARNSKAILAPATVPAFEFGSAGDFEARNDGSWGALVAYVSPDPHFICAVLFVHNHYTAESDKGKPDLNIVKTAFLASDIEITIDVFNTIRDSSNFVESASHKYTIGDGKEQKLTVSASVDQEVGANVGFRLRHFVLE